MPLIQVLSGALVALIGGTVAPWVGASKERRKWLREKLAQAAEQYVAVLTEAEISLTGVSPVIDGETRGRLHDISARLRDAASGMRLYAPREIRVAAMATVLTYNQVSVDLSTSAANGSYNEHRNVFQQQAATATQLISRRLGAD